MSALQKLQERIEQWKVNHEALKVENGELKSQLEGASGIAEAQEALKVELEEKTNQCTSLEENVSTLQQELAEKDVEIEKIITQVEALLA